jgi:hypothetical protein
MVAPMDPEEVARLGEAIYERDIRPKVEPGNVGRFLVMDVVTGEYEIADDDMTASHRIFDRHPDGVLYGIRIGYPAAFRIGGFGEGHSA